MRCIAADTIAPRPWRNGGGQTRELFAWPPGPDWQLRISLADIERDGPFSSFAGVQRYFAVLSGAGVRLQWPEAARCLDATQPPLAFDGAHAPDCTLLDGPTQDLNLMLRGLKGTLLRADALAPADWRWRALLCAGAARLMELEHLVAPGSLLVDLPQGPLQLQRLDDRPAFWIGVDADIGPFNPS